MNQSGTTAYFDNEADALRASEDLRDRGIQSDLRNASHGESFWDRIKDLFSGHKSGDGNDATEEDFRGAYGTGSVLVIEDLGNTVVIEEVITRYNGRLRGSNGPDSDIQATTMDYPASPSQLSGQTEPPNTTTGEVDYASAMREDLQGTSTTPSDENLR